MNYKVIYQAPDENEDQVVTKLTPDGHLILPPPKQTGNGQSRVNYLRERMRAKEAALVEKVAAKAEQNGTLYRIPNRMQPNHENSLAGKKVG